MQESRHERRNEFRSQSVNLDDTNNPKDIVMPTYAGIDWGGAHNQAAVLNEQGQELANQKYLNNVTGIGDMIQELHAHPCLTGVAIERTEGLLVERLIREGFRVFPVSPRISARARERHQAAPRKSDRFDAFVLADLVRTDSHKWRSLIAETEIQAELRVVTRHRRQCSQTQVAVEAQLRETLLTYHPGIVGLFSSIDRDATLAFLRAYPTPQAASRVGEARMAQFCKRIGYTGRVPAAVLVERLRSNLLQAAPGSATGQSYAALGLVDQLELLNTQLRGYNTRLGELLEAHPDFWIVDSFPAVGPVTAAELLSEIGQDRGRYPRVGMLLAEAGVAPVTLASGRMHRVRIRRACNHRLRAAMTNWAYTLKRIDDVSGQRYSAACERGVAKHGALRAVGASWLRVLWRCWQDGTAYDPARHRPPVLGTGGEPVAG